MELGFKLPRAYEAPIAVLRGDKWIENENYKAIVGEDGRVYDIVSKDYKLVEHEELVGIVLDILESMNLEVMDVEPVVSRYGAKMVCNITFREGKIMGEIVRFGIRVTNSYDRSLGINVLGYGLRLVCKNGMVAPTGETVAYSRHIKGEIGLDEEKLKAKVVSVVKSLRFFETMLERSTRSYIKALEVKSFLEKLNVSNSLKYRIIGTLKKYCLNVDLREVDNSNNPTLVRYHVYQAFTEVLTHHTSQIDLARRVELEKKVSKFLLTGGDEMWSKRYLHARRASTV